MRAAGADRLIRAIAKVAASLPARDIATVIASVTHHAAASGISVLYGQGKVSAPGDLLRHRANHFGV